MSLNLAEKKAVVSEVAKIADSANSVVAASYIGLSADQLTQLRAKARDSDVKLRIVKNTLAKRAFSDTEFSVLDEKLVGPLMLAFSLEEATAGARIFRDFIKENPASEDMVQFLWFDGKTHEASELAKIASLPTKDEAIAMLMSIMKAPVAKLARTIDAIKAAKEAA